MLKRNPIRWKLSMLVIATLFVMGATPTHAVTITTCGATCTSDCELGAELVCDETTPVAVTLLNGADLDLKAYNIRCVYEEGSSESCSTAVAAGTGSMVWSSVAPPTGSFIQNSRIYGRWDTGISCTGSNTKVLGINLRGYFNVAIQTCQTVDGNTVVGVPRLGLTSASSYLLPPPYGIYARTGAGSNLISHNYIDGFYTGIYRASSGGSGTLTIDSNTINVREKPLSAYPRSGIELSSTVDRPATVTNNIFTGDTKDPLIAVVPGHAPFTYSNNICKGSMPACAPCVAAGQCQPTGICVSP